MENIKNIVKRNLKGLERALKELGIEFKKIKNDTAYLIKAGKGVYLGRNKIKKRIIVNELLSDKPPIEPDKFGFEAKTEEKIIILRPVKSS